MLPQFSKEFVELDFNGHALLRCQTYKINIGWPWTLTTMLIDWRCTMTSGTWESIFAPRVSWGCFDTNYVWVSLIDWSTYRHEYCHEGLAWEYLGQIQMSRSPYGTKIDFAMMNNTTELEEAKTQIMWSICRSTASSFAEQWRNTWLISRELKGNLSLSCSSNSHLSSCKSCLGSSSLSRMKGRSSLGEDRYGTNARHKHAQS